MYERQAAMPSQPFQALARVIEDVVEPGATEVDASGVFPRKQVDALAGAGLLALTVPAGFGGGGSGGGGSGGGGGGLREAAAVIRELGACAAPPRWS
jgi:isovaleryl-CoA dehydrogenase